MLSSITSNISTSCQAHKSDMVVIAAPNLNMHRCSISSASQYMSIDTRTDLRFEELRGCHRIDHCNRLMLAVMAISNNFWYWKFSVIDCKSLNLNTGSKCQTFRNSFFIIFPIKFHFLHSMLCLPASKGSFGKLGSTYC